MEKVRISTRQLFALMVLFELGTSLVVPVGLSRQQSVWLSVLAALVGGILLYLVYDYLFRQYPDMPFSSYTRKILGKYVGWVVGLLYIPVFIYIAARDLRDSGDLLKASVYDTTPLFVLNVVMIIAIVYMLRKGLEVMARTGEIYLMILIGLGLLGNLLVLFSGIIDMNNLRPWLGKGWMTMLKDAYPSIFMFPFGETICFTMMLPFLNNRQSGTKTGVIALVFSGIVLSFTHAVEMSVLGADMYGRATFPLLTTISKVNVAEFLQRMDAIVILTLIIGNFFKIAVYCYAALIVVSDLFKVREQHKLVLPICVIVLYTSLMIASSWSEHLREGQLNIRFILLLFAVAIPVSLLVIHLFRKRFGLYQ